MKAIINGKIVLPGSVMCGPAVVFDTCFKDFVPADAVAGCQITDAAGAYVLPGLIDLHIHGYGGKDITGASCADILKISRKLCENGVTGWLPTVMTAPLEVMRSSFCEIRAAVKSDPRILGANSEGPFISPLKAGAQNPAHIRSAFPGFMDEFNDIIRLITIAPEADGAFNEIKRIHALYPKTVISLGHSTADYDCAVRAVKLGARQATHLFNAMLPLNHRQSGLVCCALSSPQMYCELICDGMHVSPELFKIVYKLKKNKLLLITDCTMAGGMPDGEYTLGDLPVYVKDGRCVNAQGALAGSVLTLNKAVKNLWNALGKAKLPQAVRTASLSPAEAIGIDKVKGSIGIGKAADFCLADSKLNILSTYCAGECVYTAE